MDDDDLKKLAKALRTALDECAGLSLAVRAPAYEGLGQRLHHDFVVGDLVVEQSTLGMNRPDLDGIGWFIRVAWEDIESLRAEWDEENDGPLPTERIYYIMTLDGREFRWSNARFVRAIRPGELR